MKSRFSVSHIGSLVLIVVFFLPWFRGCGSEFSGMDLALNKTGKDDLFFLYWLVPGGAILGFLITLTLRKARWLVVLPAVATLIPLGNLIREYVELSPGDRAAVEIRPAYWLAFLGVLIMCVGPLLDDLYGRSGNAQGAVDASKKP